MGRITSKIEITLKSDLCVSSGQAYAGIIDTDACFDKNGFPYIPAKRLKGIMREAAELLGYNTDKYFGVGGSGNDDVGVHCIYLEDAILEKVAGINQEISNIKINDKSTCLTEQNVTNLFSSIKAQTKLDGKGVALENTLRFTRVVNQYLPECIDDKQKETKFIAPIEFNEDDQEEINNIVKAVKHIGMDRNRGLGNVKCFVNHESDRKIISAKLTPVGNSEALSIIRYKLTNTSPMILSTSKDDVTEKYIGGQVVLGALASLYLKMKGLSEPDEVFDNIFLSGDSVFNNLYISDCEGTEHIPAPLFINRLKKTKKYVCVVKNYIADTSDNEDWKYCPENGNQPKKLNGKFVSWSGNKISVLEPQTDLVYHHSKRESFDPGRMGDDKTNGILYSQEVLKENQTFSGSIIVKEKYADIICELLKSDMLRVGKSKSAQYGHCRCEIVLNNEKEYEEYHLPTMELGKGERILITFESDCVIPGNYGYTTNYEETQEYIANQYNPKLNKIPNAKVYMSTKVIAGYNSKMNMKKNSVPAIAAGSAFEFEVAESGTYTIDHIGSYKAEGFGKIRVVKMNELSYRMEAELEETPISKRSSDEVQYRINAMQQEICKKQVLENLKIYFIDEFDNKDIGISAALLGRVTLMLKESKNNENDILTDFATRIASIKRDKERNEIISKLRVWKICNIELEKDKDKNWKLKKVENIVTKTNFINSVDDKKLSTLSEECVKSLWTDYLTFILLHMKYKKSEKSKANGGKQNE